MSHVKLHLITAVVQHKFGDALNEAILKAGASGVTFSYAQGTGTRQALGDAGREIESGKRMVQVLCEPAKTEGLLAAVREAAQLDKPGYGVAWVQEVVQAVGLAPAKV